MNSFHFKWHKKNLIILALIALSFGLFLAGIHPVIAGFLPEKEVKKEGAAKTEQYVPGELIIKFKDEVGSVLDKKIAPASLSLTPNSTGLKSIDVLNVQFKAKKMEPVFKSLKEKLISERININTYVGQVESKFPQRSARGPKDVKIPNLANIYKLVLEDKNADILAICSCITGVNGNTHTCSGSSKR